MIATTVKCRSTRVKFVVVVDEYINKMNGKVYRFCRIIKTENGETVDTPLKGRDYRNTALKAMYRTGLINEYDENDLMKYERENDFPIWWVITGGFNNGVE